MTQQIEYRWANERTWQPTAGTTEQEAADHLARLAGSTCPVPGAYRAGTRPATQVGPHRWLLPTGATIETRIADDADEARRVYCGGCGDELVANDAIWHGGVPYCRGCDEAPAEE